MFSPLSDCSLQGDFPHSVFVINIAVWVCPYLVTFCYDGIRLVKVLVDVMSHVFPELKQHETRIREIIADEEASFGRTLLHVRLAFTHAALSLYS